MEHIINTYAQYELAIDFTIAFLLVVTCVLTAAQPTKPRGATRKAMSIEEIRRRVEARPAAALTTKWHQANIEKAVAEVEHNYMSVADAADRWHVGYEEVISNLNYDYDIPF